VASDKEIRQLLTSAKTIAVVGLSSNPWRASHGVAEYMQSKGYRVIPVNPRETAVLGQPAVASLDEVEEPVDIVNVFRRPEFVPEIVSAAIRKRPRCVWMQMGVVHEEAARGAEEQGLLVVMDRCIMREHARLVGR
jgi:predicted CoA-binding protein